MPVFMVGGPLCTPAWPDFKVGIYDDDLLHAETLSFAVDVAQTQVDVGADALHRL